MRAQDNRHHLKVATLQAHHKTEAAWFGHNAFDSLATYKHWLNAMHDVHLALGLDAAHALSGQQGQQLETERLLALDADLSRLLAYAHTPDPVSDSWAWGVQYAINGSALGASILLKSAALQPGWPTAYLDTMRQFATSGALNTFFHDLNAQHLNRPEAEAGATRVFTMLESAHQDLAPVA